MLKKTFPMKVLQIASGDFFSTYGGGQVYVKHIVDEMLRQGREVAVVSFMAGGVGVSAPKDYHGAPLYEVASDDADALRRLVADVAPDVIHAHSHKGLMATVGRTLGIPVVVTAHHGGIVCPAGTLMDCHDRICTLPAGQRHCLRCVLRNTRGGLWAYPFLRLLPWKAYLALGRLLERLPFILFVTPLGCAARQIEGKAAEWQAITEGCTRMVAPCRRLAEAMVLNGLPRAKVTVLPHGIPLPARVPPFPPVTDGAVRFFYVGRISYVKGLHVLLEAFHRLDAPRAELHLIGAAATKAERRYEARLHRRYDADRRIHWHGKVRPEEVYKMTANYHTSSSSSFLEAFGLNIAEALALGKPVLATRNGGAEMQITDGVNGWFVPSNDVEAMRRKMEEIVRTLHDFDTRLATRAVTPIDAHCRALWGIYEEAVSGQVRRPR